MGKLFRAGWAVVIYFCLATILAETILLVVLWKSWGIDRDKLVQILAVAHGIDLVAMEEKIKTEREEIAPEQISYEEIKQARAINIRHLELREEALNNALNQLRLERQKLAKKTKRESEIKEVFEEQLANLKDAALVEGLENVQQMLTKIKPDQAKQFLMQMFEDNEINAVVRLLADMSDSKRAKIIGEFKTPDELEKIGEVLRLIREGAPEAKIAESTEKELN